jgi:hypothetical protein
VNIAGLTLAQANFFYRLFFGSMRLTLRHARRSACGSMPEMLLRAPQEDCLVQQNDRFCGSGSSVILMWIKSV